MVEIGIMFLIIVPDPDSGVLWIRIRIRLRNMVRIQGPKKRSKMLNNQDIILLFSDFYNILSFNLLLLMIKTYNNEVQ